MERQPDQVVSQDGTRLAVSVRGPDEAPIVVLVPGLGLSMGTWDAVAEALAAGHRLVAYDLRGNGRSADAREGDYSLAAHARDLAAVLDAFTTSSRRAVAVGHSLGGGIIVAHAAWLRQARMAAAVLVGSSAASITLPGTGGPPLLARAAVVLWLGLLRLAAHGTRRMRRLEPLADAVVRGVAFTPDTPPGPVRRTRQEFMRSRPRHLAGTALAGAAHDGIAMAPALTVSTLVVRGSRDRQVSAEDARRLRDALPDGTLAEVPGAGHNLPISHPAAVAEQVSRWVAGQREML